MSQPINVKGNDGNVADVSSNGQLYVAPKYYDRTYVAPLTVVLNIVNMVVPKTGYNFVITGLATKCAVNGSGLSAIYLVKGYNASDISGIGQDRMIYQENAYKGDSLAFAPVNILVEEGFYINSTVFTSAPSYLTITGHYEPI